MDKCATCRFIFSQKHPVEVGRTVSFCCRNPPTPFVTNDGFVPIFPPIPSPHDMMCGEHKPRLVAAQ